MLCGQNSKILKIVFCDVTLENSICGGSGLQGSSACKIEIVLSQLFLVRIKISFLIVVYLYVVSNKHLLVSVVYARAMPKIRCDLTLDLESKRDKTPCFHSDPDLLSPLIRG